MAIFVEGRVPVGNFDETVDDSLLRDLTLFLDITEDALQDAAFQIVTNTYNGVLGVKLLSAHPQGDIDDRANALTVAENIYDDLVHQPGMSQRLQVCVCIHADLADVAPTAEGYAVTGGGIVDLKMWAPRNQLTGVYATPDMVRGLPGGGIHTQSSAGGYVRLVP